ncbi:MAG: VanZ family protein [Lachnospiraceae bacterium]|nr:VanZ family protein [Lachnospiraceae bacterium]
MIQMTYVQLLIIISISWVIIRCAVGLKNRQISIKRELQMLLVYICIAVISRFVYCGFHLVNGKIPDLKIGITGDITSMISCIPFYFLVDRYDGWMMNIIGNIAMFIPVGVVWPICFRKIDSIKKDVLAGGGYSLLIELTQLLCPERHTDIDDLILNTSGVLIGACIVFAIRKLRK